MISSIPLPDLSANYRWTGGWGHLQVAGIVREIKWDDTLAFTPGHAFDLSGSELGWGVNVSSTIKLVPDKVHLLPAIVYGHGVSNYMNDATPDIAAGGTLTAPKGEAVPLLGISAYVDVYWNKLLTSSVGYSLVNLDNPSLEQTLTPTAYHRGQYASVNVLAHPAPSFLIGPELQWAKRTDADIPWFLLNGGRSPNLSGIANGDTAMLSAACRCIWWAWS